MEPDDGSFVGLLQLMKKLESFYDFFDADIVTADVSTDVGSCWYEKTRNGFTGLSLAFIDWLQ